MLTRRSLGGSLTNVRPPLLPMPMPLLRHDRAHDYKFLVRRWRTVAQAGNLRIKKYSEAGGCNLYCLASRRKNPAAPSIYLSAGIHGDEAGATEGLVEWAQKNTAVLRALNVLIFPCLNPWGLKNNSRRDPDGRDLNRSFHTSAVPQIAAQMQWLTGCAFDLALNLHEDYDALGPYIYELQRIKPYWAEILLEAAAKHIAPDPRKKIEGRAARSGVVRRTITPDLMPEWPEAFVLYFQNAVRIFTIETPSEFHLDDRVNAQREMISKAVQLCREEFSLRPRRPAAS
jgi:murein peptide amidase A